MDLLRKRKSLRPWELPGYLPIVREQGLGDKMKDKVF